MENLSLFYTIWSNPATKIFKILKYILMMSDLNSTTWANHIRLLCMMYSLPDPLSLLNEQAWSKESWKELTRTAITVHAEKKWRAKAAVNSKMMYLNVQLTGLTNKQHPALHSITDSREVPKLRIHLKFLTGDYMSFERLANDNAKGDPSCRLCNASCEDIKHILTECRATSDITSRLLPELLNILVSISPQSHILKLQSLTTKTLTQFILDCGSFNLDNNYRLCYSLPGISQVFRLSRDWCFAVHNKRMKLLKQMKLVLV